MARYRVCFVCLGNICRSPTAEGVMRVRVAEAGLEDAITVESAGTGGYHVGEPPDRRSRAEGERRGVFVDGTARQFTRADFARCDLVVAMDEINADDLRRLAPSAGAASKIRLLRSFDPASVAAGELSVPDPYYGGPDGFATVFDIVDAACRGLLDTIAAELDGD